MGYFSTSSSGGYCCDDCSFGGPSSEDNYQAQQAWPKVKRPSKRRPSRSSSKVISTTTTTTKTLVSLQSCRSLSEIETLPPTGYIEAASIVHQSTYINDNFIISDDEDDETACRDICCRER
jgi:FtsZ-interacting cell division protein YlmF